MKDRDHRIATAFFALGFFAGSVITCLVAIMILAIVKFMEVQWAT